LQFVTFKNKQRLKVEKKIKSLSIFRKQKQKQKRIHRRRKNKNKQKTKKLNEMKTKNNVQKTVLRTGAVVASFVLISFTVAAQDFWKTLLTNSSFNQIALAMVEGSKKANKGASDAETKKATYIYENEYDAKLHVEDWMTNSVYFKPIVLQKIEKENELQLEDWMKNEKLFATLHESEGPLKLEKWMTNSKVWKN
jgi:hypothetical protein